jgi:hypothetical protein
MAQTVSAIIAQTGDLAAKARLYTGDVNEASLLVGKVVSRAFSKLRGHESKDVISATLSNDLDRLIRQRQAAN